MLNIPYEVKELFRRDSIKKNIRVSFPDGERQDITNENIVQGTFTFTESLCSQSDFRLGLCEASVVQFDTIGVENIKGYRIKVDCEIDCSSLGSEWCDQNAETSDDIDFPFYSMPFGILYVDSCAKKGGKLLRRTIKAFTREAYDDWELPSTVSGYLNTAWYNSNNQIISLENILACQYPHLYPFDDSLSDSSYIRTNHITSANNAKQTVRTSEDVLYSAYVTYSALRYDRSGPVVQWRYDMTDYVRDAIDVINEAVSVGSIPAEIKDACVKMVCSAYSIPVLYSESYEKVTSETSSETIPSVADKFTIETFDVSHEKTNHGVWMFERDVSGSSYPIYSKRKNQWNGGVIYIPIGFGIRQGTATSTNASQYPCKYNFRGNPLTSFLYAYGVDYSSGKFNLSFERAMTSRNGYSFYMLKDSNISLRDITQAFAELQGKLGKYMRNGDFAFIDVSMPNTLFPSTELYPSETLFPSGPNTLVRASDYMEIFLEDKESTPFDRVSCTYTNEQGNEAYAYIMLVDDTDPYYNPDDYQSYTLGENWFVKNSRYTSTEMNALLQNVANVIRTIRYMPADMTLRSMPYIEAGDYILVNGNEIGFSTLVLRNTISGEMFLKQRIESN